METTHVDKNGVSKASYTTDYYDFKYQNFLEGTEYDYTTGTPSMVLEPGDNLRTTCWYNNDGRSGPIASHRFGLASNDEMCITFVAYYPKIPNGRYCGGDRSMDYFQ